MRLIELAIEGNPISRDLHFGQFSDGMNFIYGEKGAGKSSLQRFLKNLFLDINDSSVSATAGHIKIRSGAEEFRLQRESGLNSYSQTVSSESGQPAGSLGSIVGQMTSDLYDTVFSFSCKETARNAIRLAQVLNNQLGVPRGATSTVDDSAYLIWKQDADSRLARLSLIEQQRESLKLQHQQLQNELEHLATSESVRMNQLEDQIQAVLHQIRGLPVDQKKQQLFELDTEIAQLQIVLDQAAQQVVTRPASLHADLYVTLYQRLDEVENQLGRWRDIQSEVQGDRVRLKDEMVIRNDLTLDSERHPYHNARELLLALEDKVDQTERQAGVWNGSTSRHEDPIELAQSILGICRNMRDDLNGLCQELSLQYLQIRHKAAAIELKQLRRCHDQMDENAEHLSQQRDDIISAIRNVDPAGATAILESEYRFMECAFQEGYLTARQRFVNVPLTNTTVSQPVQDRSLDTTATHTRIEQLKQQRQLILDWLVSSESQIAKLNTQHADLLHQKSSIHGSDSAIAIQNKVQLNVVEQNRLNEDHTALLRMVETDRLRVPPSPNAILVRAANLIQQVTRGEWTEAFLSADAMSEQILVRSRAGHTVAFSTLDSAEQDQVYICLCVAAKESLDQQAIRCSLIIDDAFTHISRGRVDQTLELYSGLCRSGHQIFLLTQHQYLADRVPGIPVFELPPAVSVSSMPGALYDRQVGSSPTVDHLPFVVASANKIESMSSPAAKYPLSKYPQPDSDYIVPYTVHPVRSDSHSAQTANPLASVDLVADELGYVPAIDDQSQLDSIGILTIQQLQAFSLAGIETVGQLLLVDHDRYPQSFAENQLLLSQIGILQSQVWLLSNVPGLRNADSQILVACGLIDPEELTTLGAGDINDKIRAYLVSETGQASPWAKIAITLERIQGWQRGLQSTRSRWNHESAFRRKSRSSHRRNQSFRPKQDSPRRQSVSARSPRMQTPDRRMASRRQSGRETGPVVSQSSTRSAKPETATARIRFYLNLDDHIEAAPAIGQKTAERFEKIGVFTVSDFLKQTAESMSEKINFKRISADVIRQWQHQARLVCRIPNLRGHDAQLLVACGYTEAEEIATLQPKQLFEVIGPFAESKGGQKIIRNGKLPDLKEITDWISWSTQTRSLQAA